VYCVGKGKDHKAYEYGRKASVASTLTSQVIVGVKQHLDIEVLLPNRPLTRDTASQRQKKRILCRKRAAIEPIIGHLKQDYRLSRNWLKGCDGDAINVLMAACAWNVRKWMVAFFLCKTRNQFWDYWVNISVQGVYEASWIYLGEQDCET